MKLSRRLEVEPFHVGLAGCRLAFDQSLLTPPRLVHHNEPRRLFISLGRRIPGGKIRTSLSSLWQIHRRVFATLFMLSNQLEPRDVVYSLRDQASVGLRVVRIEQMQCLQRCIGYILECIISVSRRMTHICFQSRPRGCQGESTLASQSGV